MRFRDLQKLLAKKYLEQAALYIEIVALENQRREQCKHKEGTITGGVNISTYYDPETYSDYVVKCTICGTRLGKYPSKTHSVGSIQQGFAVDGVTLVYEKEESYR